MTALISMRDIRALMQLANEVGELHDQPQRCGTHLAEGIAKLLNATSVGIGRIPAEYAIVGHRFAAPIEPYVPLAFAGPITQEQVAQIIEMWRESAIRDPAYMHLAAHRGESLAVLREEIVSDDEWFSSGFYQTALKPAGINDKIYASTTPDEGDTVVACVSRGPGQPKFNQQDTQLLALIRDSLLPWFAETLQSHERSRDATDVDLDTILRRLPASQLVVLSLLLDGLSEAEAGARICRSKHTVHDHVKRLYQILKVTSRVELGLKLADHRPLIESLIRQSPPLYRGIAPN